MARIRTIKPELWTSESLSEVPEATMLLAIALLNYADDEGYFNANPALVRAACSPIREPSVSIPESLRRLQEIGYISLGVGSDGRRYGKIVAFEVHQRISHPSGSKIKDLQIDWGGYAAPPEPSANPPEPSVKPTESFRPERKGKEQGTGNREREGKGSGEGEGAPRDARRLAPLAPDCPDDIPPPVWHDWLALRARKKAPVTATVIEGARAEAAKAGMPMANFLREWCVRGSQGLKAEWLQPGPRAGPGNGANKQAALEARNREAVAEWLRRESDDDRTIEHERA